MKKVLLALLVVVGLQTQAQITLCDSNMTYTIGSQMQLEVAIPVTGNSLPMMAPLYAVTYGNGNMLAEDSCFSGPCTHMIYNYNPNGTYYDTLETCISYTVTDTMGYVDTLMCCFEQYWNGQFWQKVFNTNGIEELTIDRVNDDKIYDLQGRELNEVPTGSMYIRRRKLYVNLNK